MANTNEVQSKSSSEIKVVPTWAWVLAGVVFLSAQIVFNVAMAHSHNPPKPWCRALLGILAGLAGAVWILLIGYINRDAKRRGMSQLLWTVVAIIIPNALGIILYFILRQPLPISCPSCACPVQAAFSFCPHCSHKLGLSCPQCQRVVTGTDAFCPYCGCSLRTPAPPTPPAPQQS